MTHEHVAGTGGVHHAGRNVHPDARHVLAPEFDLRASPRGPVLYPKSWYTRKLCGVMGDQGEVMRKRDRRNQ